MANWLYRTSSLRFVQVSRRYTSTLKDNPHVVRNPWEQQKLLDVHPKTQADTHASQYIFPTTPNSTLQTLSLLPTSPPRSELSLGTTTSDPPTPDTFTENPGFSRILQSVIKDHAHEDPRVQAQAQAFASNAGSTLGSGGLFFHQGRSNRPGYGGGGGTGGDGAGGASGQGGAGGGGRGGHVHVSDERAPPDLGRIAYPEDIFGSLEVDSQGNFVDGHGRYQASGTYRLITRDGM